MSKNKSIRKRSEGPSKLSKPTGQTEEVIDYPVFCFKHLQFKAKKKADHKFYSYFIERLMKISSKNWDEVKLSPKHGLGTEKIPVKNIKPDLPAFVSPDVKDLLAFRANGDNRPFLGLRAPNGSPIFHVIYIEEKFGDVYDHD